MTSCNYVTDSHLLLHFAFFSLDCSILFDIYFAVSFLFHGIMTAGFYANQDGCVNFSDSTPLLYLASKKNN